MNQKQAKRLRRTALALTLPQSSPGRQYGYEKQQSLRGITHAVIVQPDCTKGILKQLKRTIKRGKYQRRRSPVA